MKRIGVVGSRTFADYALLCKVLDQFFFKPFVIVSGGAVGADSLTERYAREFKLETKNMSCTIRMSRRDIRSSNIAKAERDNG